MEENEHLDFTFGNLLESKLRIDMCRAVGSQIGLVHRRHSHVYTRRHSYVYTFGKHPKTLFFLVYTVGGKSLVRFHCTKQYFIFVNMQENTQVE